MRILAALHVHSTYSDGELSLAQVRDLFLATGCRLVCMADHADFFDELSLSAYLAECRQLSSPQIRVLPGLEFECRGRMHIVGYGVDKLVASADPVEVIDHIARNGGVSVIAHPAPEHLPTIPSLARLPDGIEVWNTKSDGPTAPRPAVFTLVTLLLAAPASGQNPPAGPPPGGPGGQRFAPPPDHWMTLDSLTQALGLTASQRTAIAQPYAALNAVMKQAADRRAAPHQQESFK